MLINSLEFGRIRPISQFSWFKYKIKQIILIWYRKIGDVNVFIVMQRALQRYSL